MRQNQFNQAVINSSIVALEQLARRHNTTVVVVPSRGHELAAQAIADTIASESKRNAK